MGDITLDQVALIGNYKRVYEAIKAEVAGLTEAQSHLKLSADSWSVVEVLTHLVDHSIVVSFRIRDILAGTVERLPKFDQDAWVSGQLANQESLEVLLSFAQALVDYNARLLERLSTEQWEQSGTNFKGETVTIAAIVSGFIKHVDHHLLQIRRILSRE